MMNTPEMSDEAKIRYEQGLVKVRYEQGLPPRNDAEREANREWAKPGIRKIGTPEELAELLKKMEYPPDGREPEQWEISVAVYGVSLDNAGYWPLDEVDSGYETVTVGTPNAVPTPDHAEMYVEIRQGDKPLAHVNLSDMLAWAAWGYKETDGE